MIHFDFNNYSLKNHAYRIARFIPVLILSLFSFNALAQCLPAPAVPQSESFNATTIPTCWNSTMVTNNGGSTPAVTFVASGSNPTSSPQQGTHMVKFNSYNCYAGGQARLESLPVNTTSASSVDVEFYWLNDNTAYTSYFDNVQVQYSTNGVTWNSAGSPYNRPDGGSGAVWNLKTLTLPAAAAGQTTLYVGFLFTSQYGDNCYLDNVSIKATPTCGVPTGVSASASSSTGASLSWTAPSIGTPIGYEYVVSTSSTTPSGSGTFVSSTSAPVSGLTANTVYYVFVRTKCGASSFSAWTAATSFTTPCNSVTLTQFEGFNNSGLTPACWSTTMVTNAGGSTPALTFISTSGNPTIAPYEGGYHVKFNSYNCYAGGQARLVSLPLNTTGVPSVDVEFYWVNDNTAYTSYFDNVQVQYSLNGTTWTNAGSAFNRPNGGSGAAYNKKTVTLPAGAANQGLVYVGLLFTSQYGDNCYLDAVTIKPSPSCFVPTNITGTPTSGSTATIAWSSPSGGTAPSNYQYTISTASTAPSGSGTTVGGTSTPVTGLTPNTTYYVYVRSFCGGTDFSTWAGPISFTTPCNASTLPYIEPFGSSLTTCWVASSNGSANWLTGTSDATHGVSGPQSGTYFAYLDVYNAVTGGNPYYLKTSPVTLPCNTSLSYYYFLGSSGAASPLDVEITTNYGASWTTLYSHTSSNSTFANSSSTAGWYPNTISLNAYTGQTIQVRFKGTSNYGVSICNMAIDELDILPKTPTATNSVQCGTATPGCAVASTTGVVSPSFRWYTVATGGTAISSQTGATLSSYPVSATTTFYVSELVGTAESRRVAVTATVNPLPVVNTNVTNVTSYGGNDGSATATVTSGTPPFTYSWNTAPVQTTATITNLIANTYTVTVTDSKTCVGTANAIVTQPGISSLPAITTQPANRVICSGTNTTFNTAATGLGITYQWYVNTGSGFIAVTNTGVYTGAQTATLTITGAPVTMNGYTYKCIASGTCTPVATTNTVSLTVNETIPAISISASATTICAGTNVNFSSTPTNGGGSPSYQWKKNGFNVATGSSYNTSTLVNGDVITCVLTSSAACPNPASVTSNSIAMTVNPIVTPTITISSNQGTTMCSGTSVIYSAAITNGGSSPQYQWKKNGFNIATGSTYTTTAIIDGDVITCVLTSNANCLSTTTATSNSLTMSIVPKLTPSVVIAATDDHICVGASTTFTATPTNGGNAPTYIWKNGGITIPGATNSTYTSSTLLNGNVITCVMTTSIGCYTAPTGTSNGITMTVDPILVPSVSIVASTDTVICAGTNVTFLALPTNGGNTPAYQWRLNGNPMSGATVGMYGLSILNTGDIISCDLISSYMCPSIPVTGSNSIKFTVNPTAPPVVGIASNKGNVIQPNETVTFTSTVLNVGPAPTYIWKRNGAVIPGVSGNSYTTSDLVNNDQVALVVVSDIECSNPDSGTSNYITMLVNATGVRNTGRQLTEVNLYPNPNSGYFTIEADVQGISGINKATYELLNNLGQLVSKGDIEVKNGVLKQDIRMNDVSSGTYFIRINLGSNSVVKKFNVQ